MLRCNLLLEPLFINLGVYRKSSTVSPVNLRGLSQEFDSVPCKSDALKANDNPNTRKRPKRPIGRYRSFPIFPRQTI